MIHTKPTKVIVMWRKLALAFGLVLAGILLGWRWQPDPPWNHQESTHTLVQRLQALQQLEVLQVHLISHKKVSEQSWLGLNHNEILIVGRGKTVYGLDLSQAKMEQRQAQWYLTLPPVTILHVMMNPNGIEFVGLQKGWFTNQRTFETFKQQALQDLYRDLQQQARSPELLKVAQQHAIEAVQRLWQVSGQPLPQLTGGTWGTVPSKP